MAGEKILVVDDNLENTKFIVDYLLVPSGYQPLTASSGRQGFELALTQAADLIILDLKLPEMSGLDVLRALREQQAEIPVILMTAYASEEDIVTSFRLGVKDHFTKPFEIQEMLATIERVLSEKRQHEQQTFQQRELQACIKELGTLYGSSLERVLNRIVEAAVAITGAEEGYLLLVDGDTDELYMRSALNLGERFARGFRLKINDSIAGRVVRTGEPLRYNYLDESDRFKIKTGYLVKALLNVPLRGGDKVIGVLGVDNRQASKVFTRTDLGLLTDLAEHAVTAIENASLYQRTHRALAQQVQELSVMQKVARDLNGILDVQRIAGLVLRYAFLMTPAEAGIVGVLAESDIVWTSRGYLDRALESGEWVPEWDAGMLGRVTDSAQPLLVFDTALEPGYPPGVPQTRSQLLAPIVRGDRVVGVIDLESAQPRAFSESHLRFLQALTDQAAVAIENTRLFDLMVGEQRKTRSILNSIADGVYTVDRDLRILTFNPAAEKITGWGESEVRGKYCTEVFRDAEPESGAHQDALIRRVLEEGQAMTSPANSPPILNCDGRPVFISSSISPMRNREGGLVGAVVAFRDVSSEREIDRLKSDFVSMVSHELRSPLASLSAAIELMLDPSCQPDLVHTTLQIARIKVQHLTQFIEDILNVSQIDAGQMKVQLEPVTLLPLVRQVIRLIETQLGQRRIGLKAPSSVPFVMADRHKLEIVLHNLLSNAVNYSAEDGRILVRIHDPQDGELVVSVIDEGIGIAGEHLSRLFDRFYRIDTSDRRKTYGHGLGLYISKHLVELQGGRIWVESQAGRGSCFSFTLTTVPEGSMSYQEQPTEAA